MDAVNDFRSIPCPCELRVSFAVAALGTSSDASSLTQDTAPVQLRDNAHPHLENLHAAKRWDALFLKWPGSRVDKCHAKPGSDFGGHLVGDLEKGDAIGSSKP